MTTLNDLVEQYKKSKIEDSPKLRIKYPDPKDDRLIALKDVLKESSLRKHFNMVLEQQGLDAYILDLTKMNNPSNI